MTTTNLLNEIAHCPHARLCLLNPTAENPCREIVTCQGSTDLETYQVPEPWSGSIEQAPVLFLSSNPSIGSIEEYPSWSWLDSDIVDYFNNRFGGGRKQWIINGTKSLLTDGTYSRSVRFWIEVRQRAIELLERDVTPGFDYALTEVVHCKSRNEIGVKQAQEKCVETYLLRILELSAAKVIVVLGAQARQAIQGKFSIPKGLVVSESIKIGKHERLFAFLPHPNARGYRSFAKCLDVEDLETLRTTLRANSGA